MSSNAGPVAALSKRDGAGAAPIHAAFLYGKADLGKVLLQKYPECALHAPGCVCCFVGLQTPLGVVIHFVGES